MNCLARLWLPIVLSAFPLGRACAIEPFHAPAVPSGSIEVRLHATEGLPPGTVRLVTFGMPFPRGSITAAQLETVRVLSGGVELPARVEEITPWRHRANPALDGTSVRVARIQFQHVVVTAFPGSDGVTVQWGTTPRALASPAYVDPRTAWHLVTTGSHVAGDNVFEPDVFAVLPRQWLTRGALKPVRNTAFDDSNGPARDSPAVNDAIEQWPGFQEAERAMKNNFFTVINQDDPAVLVAEQCPYKTLREPWLYDRAGTMFLLYFRGGSFTALREAVRAAGFYANHVDAQGFFDLAPLDSKYSYTENLAYALWTTGDPGFLPALTRVPSAHAATAHEWTPTRNFWTERSVAFKLLANAVAYEVLGTVALRDVVNDVVADLVVHQNGAGGLIVPPPGMDGGLYHFGQQHSGDWATGALGGSSWMSALVVDAMLRAYATAEDAATAQFVRRLGNFLRATTITTADHSFATGLPQAVPRYAVLIDGSDGQRLIDDIEHALDVASGLAWAAYFAEATNVPDPALRQTATDLYASYDVGVNFWIRPLGPQSGRPAFRVAPWRKWGWEHRVSDGFAFAMASTGVLFSDGFE